MTRPEISVVRFDPFGGTVRERLFVSPRSADDSGGSEQVWPEYLRADRSGRYVLIAVDAPIGYQLFVWSKAQGLKKITDARLRDVAWATGKALEDPASQSRDLAPSTTQ